MTNSGGPFGPMHPEKDEHGNCWGFTWAGQELVHCNTCGAPYWEHEFIASLDRVTGWYQRPIPADDAANVKARLGSP